MLNRRRIQHTERARIEHHLTLTRLGELNERDTNLLTRSLLYSLSGKKAAIIEGLIASPGVGLSVDLTAPASLVQNIGDGVLSSDVKLCTDENIDGSDFNIVLTTADPTNPRIDIIEATIKVRSAFTDTAVGIVDAVTKSISPQTRDRDYELYLDIQKVDGTPAGSPTPPSTTAATAGSLTSTVAISTTIDLSTEYILNIALGKDGEYTEIDCRGGTPSATTAIEIRDAINAALPGSPASIDGGDHIVITAPGTGELSIVKFKQPTDPALDAYTVIMGGTISVQYFDFYEGTNAYFKIAEIFVPATATSLTADNIRSREEKDTLWDSDASTIINSITFQEHRDSLPMDHVAGSVDYSHLSAGAIAQLTSVISSLGTKYRGTNAVIYNVTGDATFRKGTVFKHDEELVTALFVSQLDSDFEQEFPVYRVDQRQDDATGVSTYAVPVSLSEAAGDKWSFTPGTLINDGTNYYQVQTAYGTSVRVGIYLQNGISTAGFTHVEIDIHDVSDTLLGSVQIPIADLQAVDVGWIYANITLSSALSLSTTYHLHFHLIGETAPTTLQLALDTTNTNLAYREMYLPTAGKYGGASEADVLKLLDNAGNRLVPIRATGADDISIPGDGFIGFSTGTNYDWMPVDFSNTTHWTNWQYEDYMGVDRTLGRIKLPSGLTVFILFGEYNTFEPISELDAKHFLRHTDDLTNVVSIEDYIEDRLDPLMTIEGNQILYNARWDGANYRHLSNAKAYYLDIVNKRMAESPIASKGTQASFYDFPILYPGYIDGTLKFQSASLPPTISAGVREIGGIAHTLEADTNLALTDTLGAISQTLANHAYCWMQAVIHRETGAKYWIPTFDITQSIITSITVSSISVTSNVATCSTADTTSGFTPLAAGHMVIVKSSNVGLIIGKVISVTADTSFTVAVNAADDTYTGGTYDAYPRIATYHGAGVSLTLINTDGQVSVYDPSPVFCPALNVYGLDQYGIPTTIAANVVYRILGPWFVDVGGIVNAGDIISYKSGFDKDDNEIVSTGTSSTKVGNIYRLTIPTNFTKLWGNDYVATDDGTNAFRLTFSKKLWSQLEIIHSSAAIRPTFSINLDGTQIKYTILEASNAVPVCDGRTVNAGQYYTFSCPSAGGINDFTWRGRQ